MCYMDMVSINFSLFWENQADVLLIENQKFLLCSWRKTVFFKANVSSSVKVITWQVFSLLKSQVLLREKFRVHTKIQCHIKRLLRYYQKRITSLKENKSWLILKFPNLFSWYFDVRKKAQCEIKLLNSNSL